MNVFLSSSIPDLRKGFKLKNWPLDPDHTSPIFMREMGLAKIYPYTEFELPSFTRSRDTAVVPIRP